MSLFHWLFLSLVLASPSAFAAPGDLRLATSADTYPFNFGTADGCKDARGVCGFEVELFDAVCAEAGLKCSWQIAPWGEIDQPGSILHKLVTPVNGTFSYDMVVASTSATAKRSGAMLFSASYYTAWNIFVGKKALNPTFDDKGYPVDVATQPLRIGTWAGSMMEDLKKVYGGGPRYLKLIEVADPVAALKKGDVDLIYTFTGTEVDLVRDGSYAVKGKPIDNDTGPEGAVGSGLRKNAEGTAWQSKVNNGLIALRKNGKYRALSTKWLGRDVWDCKYGPKFGGDGC